MNDTIHRLTASGPRGEAIEGVRLVAANGTVAQFIDHGATLTHLFVADRNGARGDVVLGYDDPAQYFGRHPHVGCIVGRCANRIRDSRMVVNGETFMLAPTHGPHHLHGGPNGFHTQRWAIGTDATQQRVRFTLDSPDGDQGYPGNVHVTATYSFTADNALRLEIEARCDRATPINLTAHHYFNLAGDAADVRDHSVRIAADHYLPMDTDFLPTGAIAAVDDTVFDLRGTRRLGDCLASSDPQIHLAGGGFDHHFVLAGTGLRFCAEVSDPISGRQMSIYTDQRGVQFYTGNSLDIVGKAQRRQRAHGGLCLETQAFPNAINEPSFPSVLVDPELPYRSITEWRFDTLASTHQSSWSRRRP